MTGYRARNLVNLDVRPDIDPVNQGDVLRAAPGSSGPGCVRGQSGEDRTQFGAGVACTVASSLDYLEAGISMCRA
jgi:hypothetical protein